jgi:hypothetical protein
MLIKTRFIKKRNKILQSNKNTAGLIEKMVKKIYIKCLNSYFHLYMDKKLKIKR